MMEKNKKMQRKAMSIFVLSIIAFVVEVAALAWYIILIVDYVRDLTDQNYDFAKFLNSLAGSVTGLIFLAIVYLALAIAIFVLGIITLTTKLDNQHDSLRVTVGVLAILSAFVIPFALYIANIICTSLLLKKLRGQQEPKVTVQHENSEMLVENTQNKMK